MKAAAEGEPPTCGDPSKCARHDARAIDGETVIAHDDGTPGFHAAEPTTGCEVVLYDGEDLRNLPLIDRKRRLAS